MSPIDGSSFPLPRYGEQHRVEEAFLPATTRVEGGERVGEAKELGPEFLLGFDQCAQRVGVPVGLQQHGGVDAVQRGGVNRLELGIPVQNTFPAASAYRALRRRIPFGKQRLLQAGLGVGLDPFGGGINSGISQQVLRTLSHRQQTHHALGLTDDAPSPAVEVDAHRLGKATDHVEW